MSFRYLQAQKPADWIRHRYLVLRRACSGVVSQGIRLNKITLLSSIQTPRSIKMEKPVIYTQTIHTPAESRNATVAIRETDTAGQAVAWSVSYCVEYHNTKYGESKGTVYSDIFNSFSELSDAIKDFFKPVKMA